MPTTQEEKRAKQRPRNRKADQRNPKAGQKAEARLDSETNSPVVAPIESAPAAAALEEMAVEDMALEEMAVEEVAEVEEAADTALSGQVLPPQVLPPQVLPPDVREHAAQAAGLPAIVQVYGEYTRKSWAAGRVLVERLVAARSIDEAVEIQGEFARQACANFAAQSQKICELYGDWVQQMFKPFEKFTTDRGSRTLH
jgi:Phasin protein